MSYQPRQLDFFSALTPVATCNPVRERRRTRGARAYRTGHAAEDAAERHYAARGARILDRRFRVREGEIDLVVQHDGVLVFCEVKARRSLEEAAASIQPRQWQRLEQAANRYMVDRNVGAATPMRFDVVLMDRHGSLEVVENAHLF
ncbi:YraN family protein [Roseobacter sp. HKCCA0434]|uniref:YraN family protein n=1 Tax=Roseobacter sp. HKCCA0434 TaxID=3079297 RepID=UPI002905CBC7|nr:YraN family protein [Roseobacter sp. HKCCA0434]